jgi:hypothetical protein
MVQQQCLIPVKYNIDNNLMMKGQRQFFFCEKNGNPDYTLATEYCSTQKNCCVHSTTEEEKW